MHFIDIITTYAYESSRSQYHIADQDDPEQLNAIMQKTGGNFDVIIDDGGHTMSQQITSFTTLFPHVKSRGVYIIEDLHTSYYRDFQGGTASLTTLDFLRGLIDDLNYVGKMRSEASHRNLFPAYTETLSIYKKEILSITFYDSLAIISKR